MGKRLRAKCPMCGMMAYIEVFRNGAFYKIEVYEQIFGGKVPGAGYRKGKGKAPGVMEYRNITATKQGKAIVREIKDRLSMVI